MNKNKKSNRKYSHKALDRVNEILKKYPDGISDVSKINSEARAWLQVKIQQQRECLKKVRFSPTPEWFEPLRLTRNKTAHITEDFTDAEFSTLCETLFKNIGKISSDLQANIKRLSHPNKKKRKFEKFAPASLGTETERKQLVDALEDMANPVEPKDEKIEFPKNKFAGLAEQTLSEILSHENTRPYLATHEGLSENIQTDILDWLEQTRATIENENPFSDEEALIARLRNQDAETIAEDLTGENKIPMQYKKLPSVDETTRGTIAESDMDFDFYGKEFSAQKKVKADKDGKETLSWKSAEKLETLRRNFISDMEKNLVDRKNKWEQERIDALRRQFLEELYKKIDNFMRLEKLLAPFIGNLGRLWDLSSRPFETSGFEILERFASLLEQDESLRELASLIGKQERAQAAFEKEMRDKVVIKSEWHPEPAYRGEIDGLRYSNDIASALPCELALLKNPATKKLFQLKFAQKQLLSFDFRSEQEKSREETETEEISVAKKEPKGPVIVCVDTSGSMSGTPENIAKTVTFALAKIAIEEERKCYVISFSTGIETLDMSDFASGDALAKLVQFLRMSFNGGTDASPALHHAVQMLQKNGYRNADVLMISDFVMGTPPDDLVGTITAEKENGTDFYSLVIGTSGNKGTIECFNHNWVYDTTDAHAARRLVERLHELRISR